MVRIMASCTSAGRLGVCALNVDLVGAVALGFQEQQVRVLAGEADDLVFDRGAVARAGGGDGAVVHRRPVEVVADQRVGLRRGVDLVAGHLGAPAARWDVRIDGVRRRLVPLGSGRRIEAEPQRLLAAMLHARAGVINAVGGQSRRRAGLGGDPVPGRRFSGRWTVRWRAVRRDDRRATPHRP